MSVKQSFVLALKSLSTSKVRSLLTMLGIIIGVAAVIVIISLGDGMQQLINDQFEQMGSNLIQVQVFRSGSSREVDTEDMYQFVQEHPDALSAISPYINVSAISARGLHETFTPKSVFGVSEEYDSIRAINLDQGRFLQYVDILRSQKVCIIGSYINQEYYDGQGLGQTLGINGYNYTIVGILSPVAESRKGTEDDQIIVPYTNAQQLNSISGYSSGGSLYMLSGTSKDTASSTRRMIENYLRQVYGDDDYFTVITSAEILDMMNTVTGTMMVVLVTIAAMSLLVGGIGIMNIMLVSVSERTREIGIRKSLGGKRKDIRSQFIIEAGTTSAIGGLIGIGLGIITANIFASVIGSVINSSTAQFSAVVSPTAIGVAFGVSVCVGVLFGYLPANKAAKLNPIDALRYE